MKEKRLKVAIHSNNKIFRHSTMWDTEWIDYCVKNKIDHEVVDCFSPAVAERLHEFDCILWHVGNTAPHILRMGQTILYTAEKIGVKVFPDYNTLWHHDDKTAEAILLKATGCPIPDSWTFFVKDECIRWLNEEAVYPLVAKLRCGSGSNNVKLVNSASEAVRYAKRMFGRGYRPVPGVLFKAVSNLQSSRDWATIKKRIKRIPDFIQHVTGMRNMPPENKYASFQEFIPNKGYDLKIVVIGDKLSFIARNVRKGDFRASGGGDLFYDRNAVTPDIIRSAFDTTDKLGAQCMGYDYVVDERDNTGKIIEMSYGFSHAALLDAGGYWDRSGKWHNEPLNAPEEIIKNLLAEAGIS